MPLTKGLPPTRPTFAPINSVFPVIVDRVTNTAPAYSARPPILPFDLASLLGGRLRRQNWSFGGGKGNRLIEGVCDSRSLCSPSLVLDRE